MKKEYNAEATEALKQLPWRRITSGGGCHSTDYSHETVTMWQDIRADSVERLVNAGADIYTIMPDGSRWIDNIIIIGNVDVINKLIDIDAIDITDNENLIKTCLALIENHDRTSGFCVLYKQLGEKKQIDMIREIDELEKKYEKQGGCDLLAIKERFGLFQPVSDYKPVFKKLFQKGLDPKGPIGTLGTYSYSLSEICDVRIRGLNKGKYYWFYNRICAWGWGHEDTDNASGAEELKEFFASYSPEKTAQRQVNSCILPRKFATEERRIQIATKKQEETNLPENAQ